jgi:hypothetical protein
MNANGESDKQFLRRLRGEMTPEREAEIEKEVNSLGMWFCSNWIKDIARDLVAQRDALRASEFHANQQYWDQKCAADEFQLKVKDLEKERDALRAEADRTPTSACCSYLRLRILAKENRL